MPRCPGQNPSQWKPEDVSEVKCSSCGRMLEFWKDEPARKCSKCGQEVRNPTIDMGCAKWCKFADQCLGGDQDVTEREEERDG